MVGVLQECQSLYGTENLYELLGIHKDASQNEVKRAYHKLSLKVHPDRVDPAEKEAATKKFQALGKVYSVLSDGDKRALYDESGEIDEEDDSLSQDRDWYDYWRLLFSKISVKDIQDFEEKYKGSDEELNDLKAAYCDYEGSMEEIVNNVLCATEEDEERFRGILQDLVNEKEVPKFKAFTNETKSSKRTRKRRAAKEAEEAEELKKELGIGEDASLHALIAKKHESRGNAADSFFAHLEEKYAQPKKGKGKKSK